MSFYYKKCHVLLQNTEAFLLQNAAKFYRKTRKFFNTKLVHFIPKCGTYYKPRWFYHKTWHVLQSALVIRNIPSISNITVANSLWILLLVYHEVIIGPCLLIIKHWKSTIFMHFKNKFKWSRFWLFYHDEQKCQDLPHMYILRFKNELRGKKCISKWRAN